MAECLDKNMIDKDEYPQTAALEMRCVNMLSKLWHAPDEGVGCSTTGSSEAAMLGGLALKRRWQKRRAAAGEPTDRPNLVMGINVQVCWEKFANYWDVEMRARPDGGRPLPPVRRGGRRAVRREHDRRRGDPRLDLRRLVRAGQGDLRRARRPPDADRGWTCRCTSTAHPARSSRRSSTPSSSGTSGCRAWPRSTPPATSTGSSTPASAGRSGATRRRCPRTSSSGSTTSATTCRPSRSTSRVPVRRSWRSTTTSCGSGSTGTRASRRTRARSRRASPREIEELGPFRLITRGRRAARLRVHAARRRRQLHRLRRLERAAGTRLARARLHVPGEPDRPGRAPRRGQARLQPRRRRPAGGRSQAAAPAAPEAAGTDARGHGDELQPH